MAGEDWAPIDSSTPSTAERVRSGSARAVDDPVAGVARLSSRVQIRPTARSRRPAVVLALVAAAVVVGLAVATVTTGGVTLARPADPFPADPFPADAFPGEGTDSGSATARRAVAIASERLRDAGTFAYRGTVQADQASWARPGIWVAADVTVEGEVVLPVRTHEVATDADGRVSETVTEHVVVWGRQASHPDGIEAQAFEVVAEASGEVSVESGAALLPAWLAVSTDRREDGTDSGGRRRYRATVPGTAFLDPNGGVSFADADMVLTIDAAGDPVHIEVTSRPGGPLLAMALDIDDIGEPLTVDLPGGRPTSVTGDVTPDQVRAAGISDPVEFGVLPEGWILYSTGLLADSPRAGCSTLELYYQDATTTNPASRFVTLRVASADCSFQDAFSEAVAFGSFSGTAGVDSYGVFGEVTDGRTAIEVFTDLTVEDVDSLFASLEPFDPATQPGSVDGIPSS
jgi:hypothetical protein